MSPGNHSVKTTAHFNCNARQAWEKVCFYEHIELQPTWLLRTALPVPERTTGAYRRADDISGCQYSDGGFLTKRILEIEEGRVVFEVIRQSIRYAGRIDLRGGTIRVTPRGAGSCAVEMITRYELRNGWLKLLRAPINYVVKAMHRIVIRDMRARLEGTDLCLDGHEELIQ